MIKVGVVGIGNMGRNHVRVLKQLENETGKIRLEALMDVRKDVVKHYSKMYGCRGYTDLDEFIRKEDLDGVVVAVPTHLHREVSIPLIEEGINLLIEKPMAKNSVDARKIYDLSHRHNVKILVGHIERFNPAVRKMKELIKEGHIGRVLTISAKRVGPGGLNTEIFDKKIGVTMDLAIHDLDIFQYILENEINRIITYSGSLIKPYEYDDYSFSIAFIGKVIGMAEANWLTPYKLRKLYVTGTEGVFELDYISQTLLYSKEMGREPDKIDVVKVEPLYNELKHFINVLEESEEPMVSAEDAYRLITLIEVGRQEHIANGI